MMSLLSVAQTWWGRRRDARSVTPGRPMMLRSALSCALVAALVVGCTPGPQPVTGPSELPGLVHVRDLPRIPWEGGPQYWARFRNAGDWTDPNFFPIGIWFGNVATDEQVQFDKSKGINTYVGMWEGTDFGLFERNEVYWLGQGLAGQDETSRFNPGVFLDDEVDGRFSPKEGFEHLAKIRAGVGKDRFTWANFSQIVVGPDLPLHQQERYVNDTADVASIDMYWYSIPFCDWKPYRGEFYAVPIPEATCRTAHSYGLSQEGLRLRDAAKGGLQPAWTWVENFNGLSGQSPLPYVTGGQLKGAAMSVLIHEARALMWFNQSFTGECIAGNVIREAQQDPDSACGRRFAANIDAMGEINQLVASLAPVLNTQSYRWKFGDGLDTMLKVHGDSAYIFAMTDGTAGPRVFRLPPGLKDAEVEVVGEQRTLAASNGLLRDNFEHEYTYHVYKVSLA